MFMSVKIAVLVCIHFQNFPDCSSRRCGSSQMTAGFVGLRAEGRGPIASIHFAVCHESNFFQLARPVFNYYGRPNLKLFSLSGNVTYVAPPGVGREWKAESAQCVCEGGGDTVKSKSVSGGEKTFQTGFWFGKKLLILFRRFFVW